METIYDPVFQWSYNGTAGGKVRNDGKFCGLKSIKVKDSSDKSGAWLERPTEGRVNNVADGNLAIALHGWLPSGGNVALASLGAAREKDGKAVLLAAGPKRDTLSAHVIASVPGAGYGIVSTKTIPVPAIESPDKGWGWLVEQGFTIIETNHTRDLIQYLKAKGEAEMNDTIYQFSVKDRTGGEVSLKDYAGKVLDEVESAIEVELSK